MAHAAAYQLDSETPGSGGGGSFSGDVLTLGTEGVAQDWKLTKDTATNKRWTLSKNSVPYVVIDPVDIFTKQAFYPQGEGFPGVRISNWGASGDTADGVCVTGVALSPAEALVLVPDRSGAAGKKLQIAAQNATEYKVGLEIAHVTSGNPVLKLCVGTTLSLFGATGTAQGTGGASTADGGGTTQTMVQTMWDWLRAAGALT